MPKPSPSPASPPTIAAADWALLLVLSLLWGGSFYFAKIAVREMSPFALALGRVGIAAAILCLIIRASGHLLPRDGATWRIFAVMALLNNVIPFVLLFWSQIHISVGMAAILNATTPLFGVLIAHVLTTDDKLTVNRTIGLIAGFVGVVLLIGHDLAGEFGAHVLAEMKLDASAIAAAE